MSATAILSRPDRQELIRDFSRAARNLQEAYGIPDTVPINDENDRLIGFFCPAATVLTEEDEGHLRIARERMNDGPEMFVSVEEFMRLLDEPMGPDESRSALM